MNDDIYEITLADDTVISDLILNGNNFVSTTEITEDMFHDNLSSVTITNTTTGEVIEQGASELVQIATYDFDPGKYYFILREFSQQELDEINLRADLDYALMMLDDF